MLSSGKGWGTLGGAGTMHQTGSTTMATATLHRSLEPQSGLGLCCSKHPRQPFAVNCLQVPAIQQPAPFGVYTGCEDVINTDARPEAT